MTTSRIEPEQEPTRAGNAGPRRPFSLRQAHLALVNLLLTVMFASFAWRFAMAFIEDPRLSWLLVLLSQTLFVVLSLARRDPERTWHSLNTWLMATGGTLAPLLLRPVGAGDDLAIGQLLQLAGSVLEIAAILSLNRSFGILPAYRGIQTGGLYRWTRHPLYSAYAIGHLGFLISNASLANIAIVVVGTAFQVMRIRNEETLLFEYPDYSDYAARTRWRLIPFAW